MATEFDQKFARFGLTQAQFRLMLAVWEAGAETASRPRLWRKRC